jgi:hypothetical protein
MAKTSIMPRRGVIRIGVIENGFPLSGIWSIIRNQEDIYVAPRSIAGSFKVSLHASGLFRFGFTSDEKAKRFIPEDSDRAVFKWKRPTTDSPALVLLQLMFPASALLAPLLRPQLHQSSIGLRIPRPGECTVVSIIETVSSLDIAEIGAETYETRTLEQWQLEGDRKIWIVEHIETMSIEFVKGLEDFRRSFPVKVKSSIDVELPDSTTSHLRCFAALTDPNVPLRFVDIDAEHVR